MQIATDVGFAPPVLVKSSIITCEEPEMKKMAGRQSLLCLPLSLLCPLLFSSLFSFSISFFPYPSFSVFSSSISHFSFSSSSSYLLYFSNSFSSSSSFSHPCSSLTSSSSFSPPCSSLISSFTTTTYQHSNSAIIIPHPQSLQGVFSFALPPTV